ncbi:MAG: lipopolysaccharide biosynthesis protein [Sandaracinaceae bacterium]|nr:lipopolysaccharide biosynthesis protein [Sandaracinaceae bacterium]
MAVLMSGTLVAQILSFAATPLLSRVFSPEDFGVLGLVNSVANLFVGVAGLRYDVAVVVPKEEARAANLLALSLVAVAGTSMASLGSIALTRGHLAQAFGSPELSSWLWVAPAIVLATGWYNALSFWSIRHKSFRRLSISAVLASLSGLSGKLSGGLLGLGAPGLIGGQIVGQLVATLALGAQIARDDLHRARRVVRTSEMRKVAREHWDFPAFQAPTTILNSLAQNLPVYVLGALFTAQTVGQWAITMTLITLPVQVVAGSVRQVMLQRTSEAVQEGEGVHGLLLRSVLGLSAAGALPVLVIVVFAPWAFPRILGAQWAMAGELARYVSIWQLTVLSTAPVAAAFPILRLQRVVLVWQVAGIALSTGALLLASTSSAAATVMAFALTMALMNVALILIVLRGAKGFSRQRDDHHDAG